MTEATTAPNPFDFPDKLIEAQQAAAEAFAALHRFQADPELPWSREPHEGWEEPEPAHGGVLQGYKSSRPATKGWSAEQVVEYEKLWEACRDTSVLVHTHPHWERFTGPDAVAARQALKRMPGAQPGAAPQPAASVEPELEPETTKGSELVQDDVAKAV
ncbi:hypothetical protein [Streptomyces sp. MZ04]|uniref:hypothetical protein n=1 Tax=Streptomyces sp. MZ04 TaxID=2559236 RepID=UPI00107E64E7|nr:hypothetical protein [Streptomyces sp. MZ04]TGB03224.1 hypothetical protein E2651_25695 [Streptomyces sp. MZ04]